MAVIAVLALILAPVGAASAYWPATGTGTAVSTTAVLPAPTDVTVPATSTGDVTVAWTPSSGSPSPTGYFVTRTAGAVTVNVCGSSAAVLLTGTSCVDPALADGTYSYRVTAVFRTWTARSLPSASVVVTLPAPSLLGDAASYSVLGGAVTNTLTTTVSGDLGVSPAGTIAGFPDGIVEGDIHLNDAHSADGQSALAAAYADLSTREPTTTFSGDLNGRTFTAGVHHTEAALELTGTLTLNGDANDIFIFQVNAALNTAAASQVVLTGGALAANVYWVVNGAAGTGADSTFVGSILADGAITLGARSVLIGHALATGTVTLSDNTIRFTDALPPTLTITGGASVVTKDTTPTIAGTTDAGVGQTVTVTVGAQTLTTTVQSNGTWSVTAAELAPWNYSIVAKVKDAAGNGATATQTILVEANPAPLAIAAASTFSVLADTSVVGNGTSTLGGALGVGVGGTITGFPPGTAAGGIHIGDQPAADAKAALLAAYADGIARPAHTEFSGDQNGQTLHAGVHETATAFSLTGTLTLDGEGDPNAVFIIHVRAAMTTAANTSVVLINGATAANVFWVVEGAADTGADSTLVGTILADGPITLGARTNPVGRALSTGTVTLADVVVVTP